METALAIKVRYILSRTKRKDDRLPVRTISDQVASKVAVFYAELLKMSQHGAVNGARQTPIAATLH